jgi:hypothetical protein
VAYTRPNLQISMFTLATRALQKGTGRMELDSTGSKPARLRRRTYIEPCMTIMMKIKLNVHDTKDQAYNMPVNQRRYCR